MDIADKLFSIIGASAVGTMVFFTSYPSLDGRIDYYLNKRAIEEHVAQSERREPQSETIWDHLQGKGDIALAGLIGVGAAVLYYKLGEWQDKKEREKRMKEMKAQSPDLYQIVQMGLGDNPKEENEDLIKRCR